MAQRFVLDNGLTVVFEPQHTSKVAAFQMWVNAGSADERPDQAGLAHLHEHMLFKGTQNRGPGEIAYDIEAHGGEINAWTSYDQTVYHLAIASQYAEHGLEVLSDAVRRSAFDPGELSREIEVVCEEIKRSHDAPSRRAWKDLFRLAYRVHPYQRPVIGTEASVRSFTREKVLEFYGRHYAPRNVVLAAAGDVDPKALRAWAKRHLGGSWGRRYPGPVRRATEPKLEGPRTLLREDGVQEAYLHLAFPIVSSKHKDTPALELLALIAGQGDASRLSLELKLQRAWVNDVSASAYTPKDAGLFIVSLTLAPNSLRQALEETGRQLQRLCRSGVSAEELATAKALVESSAVYQRETAQGMARKLGYYQLALGGIEKEARYYEAVSRVTREQVKLAAQKYLRLDRCVVTGLLPQGSALRTEDVERALGKEHRTLPPPPKRRDQVPLARGPLRVKARPTTHPTPLTVERLPSGATVIVKEERTVPLFAARAVYLGGLRYESPDQNGLTTLFTRTLARGTKRRDAETIARTADSLSGLLSASGGRNTVSVRGEFLTRHFEPGFELFAEVLREPAFPRFEVERERALQQQDILARNDRPSSIAFELFAKTLYSNHPYRLSLLGEAPTVEQLDSAALKAYHARHLDPSQLTLCVVGDVDTAKVLDRAKTFFGRKGRSAQPPPPVPGVQPLSTPREAHHALNKAQAHLVTGFLAARVTDPWRRALEVLSTVLSGQGGRLFLELRDKRSLAYSVTSFAVDGLEPGYFAVYIGTSPEKLTEAREGIRRELTRIREERISDAELERAKQHLVGTHEIGLQRNGARAAVMALDQLYGLGVDASERYPEEVLAITAEDVRAVAQRVIDFDQAATVVVGPKAPPEA